jgi:hypothetical protein
VQWDATQAARSGPFDVAIAMKDLEHQLKAKTRGLYLQNRRSIETGFLDAGFVEDLEAKAKRQAAKE